MGRPTGTRYHKCSSFPAIDLAHLNRRGVIASGRADLLSWTQYGETSAVVVVAPAANGVRLYYQLRTRGAPAIDVEEQIDYVTTRTAFGGRRTWLCCPGCLRGVRVLYGAARFRCRRCLHLRYASQYEGLEDRHLEQAQLIRKRLGDAVGSAFEGDPFPDRPKGMHRKTYGRLRRRYAYLQSSWKAAACARFGVSFCDIT